MDQAKIAAQAAGSAVLEGAKLAKGVLSSAYDASKELVSAPHFFIGTQWCLHFVR